MAWGEISIGSGRLTSDERQGVRFDASSLWLHSLFKHGPMRIFPLANTESARFAQDNKEARSGFSLVGTRLSQLRTSQKTLHGIA